MKSVYFAIQCQDCGDVIISRAHHDFNSCSCDSTDGSKGIYIDGNSIMSTEDTTSNTKSYYIRIGGNPDRMTRFHVTLPFTPGEIYQDWNRRINKLAKIDPTIYNLERIED